MILLTNNFSLNATDGEVYSKVKIMESAGSQVIAIDPSQKLPPGVYLVTATSDMNIYKQRMVVE